MFYNQVEGDSKMVSRCESTPHLTQAVIKEEHEVVITTILNLFLVKVDKKYPSMGVNAKPSKNVDNSWKLEESKKFTVAPAYNKGAYQVIPKGDIKWIGK